MRRSNRGSYTKEYIKELQTATDLMVFGGLLTRVSTLGAGGTGRDRTDGARRFAGAGVIVVLSFISRVPWGARGIVASQFASRAQFGARKGALLIAFRAQSGEGGRNEGDCGTSSP